MIRILRLPLALGLLLLCCAGLAAEPERGAEEAVRDYIDSLLARVAEIKPLYESDREHYDREVEQALAGFVDFREVARGVMARYSTGPRGATDAQLDRFAEVFKDSMIDFYGSALASYGGQDYEFLDSRRPSDNPGSANVRMLVRGDDGDRFELQYSMFLNDEGIWKLRNVYVEGVNLRRQYHSRFDDLMSRHGYDIDKVIDIWEEAEGSL